MLSQLQRAHSSHFWRLTYVVCALFLAFYVVFDVTDLDDFQVPLKLERPLVPAEVTKRMDDMEPVGYPAKIPVWQARSALLASILDASLFHGQHDIFTPPRFDLARARGYRVGLPRSFTTDGSPSA